VLSGAPTAAEPVLVALRRAARSADAVPGVTPTPPGAASPPMAEHQASPATAGALPLDDARAVLARYDRPGPRYASYPPPPAWRTADAAGHAARLAAVGASQRPLAVYVHLPFCASQCLYCGCDAAVTNRRDVMDAYLARLAREADLVAAALGPRQRVTRLHWGGGTPNHLDDAQLARAMGVVTDRFDLAPDAELSVEADPRLATPRQLRTLAALGFRRVSFGVQDLDRDVQLAIGRRQPEPTVRAAVEAARAAGFTGVHVDLIYGLPLQTVDGFRRTAAAVLALAPDCVACFGYAHVPGMRAHQRRLDATALPASAARLALFAAAADVFTGAGYAWVGMDHFAAPGDPLARAAADGTLVRDFTGYAAPSSDAPAHLVGLGMSAISSFGPTPGTPHGAYVQNAARLAEWQRLVDAGTLPVARGHALTPDDRRRAGAVRSLMCRMSLLATEADALLARAPETARAEFARMAADGLVTRRRGEWRVTPLGRLVVRSVCMLFDTDALAADAADQVDDAGPPRLACAG
jgi:oxygen-independent coproporphyrinogen-3 oxidase